MTIREGQKNVVPLPSTRLPLSGDKLRSASAEPGQAALCIGIGLAGGIALATMSRQQWRRFGSSLLHASLWLLRSPLGPAALAALLARATAPAADTDQNERRRE